MLLTPFVWISIGLVGLNLSNKFHGHNIMVAKKFVCLFNGNSAQIGDLHLVIDQIVITQATVLECNGETWFKTTRSPKFKNIPWGKLLKVKLPPKIGEVIPISLFEEHYQSLMIFIKQFITCEKQYGVILLYHVQLLMVFLGYKLNMSYFLYKIFSKMAYAYQRELANSSLFHSCLINILVEYEFNHRNDDWESFLAWNNFNLSHTKEPTIQTFPCLLKLKMLTTL